MASATLSRGNTTIEIPLEREGGDLLVASSFGKPEVQIRSSGGTLNPRANDRWSGVHNIELEGTLFNYQTSHDLADLIKSASEEPLTLDIPSDLYPDTLTVAPSAGADTALTLTYPAGLLGLGAVQAIPTGSSPFRQVQQAGRGWAVVPTLELRRIFNPRA